MFTFTISYSQTTTSEQNLELTETNIKRLIKLNTEWTACFISDSAYITADTINLYSDIYYYLTTECCYETSWKFTNSTTFNMSDTKVCQEPPVSTINFENGELKIRFVKSDNVLTMTIYNNKILKDEFNVVSLDYVELRKDQFVYRLTMVR